MSKSQPSPKAARSGSSRGEESAHLKKSGRRERKARETRLRLFRAALQLFADRGFQNVTVEDITDAADVGKGTFFNYFDSKEHVLVVMPELQLGHVAEAVQAAHAGKQSIQSILRHMFHRLSVELGRSPQWARTVAASFLAGDIVRDLVQRRMLVGRTAAASVIVEGQRRGEIDPKLDSTGVALQIQQVLVGTVLLWSLHGEQELPACAENSFRLFWRSIAAKSREQRS